MKLLCMFLLMAATAACDTSADIPVPAGTPTEADSESSVSVVRAPPAPRLTIRNLGDGWAKVPSKVLRYEHTNGMTVQVGHAADTTVPPATAAGRSLQQLWQTYDSGRTKPAVSVSADGAYAMFSTRLPPARIIAVAFRRIDGTPGLVRVVGIANDERHRDDITAVVRTAASSARFE